MSKVKVSQNVTKKSASNLAMAFVLLPKEKKDAMCALYAFCREVDDVADEESVPVEDRRRELARWREDIRKACHGGTPDLPVNIELQPFIERFKLPCELFEALIDGMEMDLEGTYYETWDDLAKYCYHVASVVGLLSIEIFEYTHPATKHYGYQIGQALQLTNILRDIRQDAKNKRIYVPRTLMEKHGVTEEDLYQFRDSQNVRDMARELAERARYHYAESSKCIHPDDRQSLVASEMMGAVYWRILLKIEKSGYNVMRPSKFKLSKTGKLWLVARSFVRHWLHAKRSDYAFG
jgi:phytoene synthase